MANMIKSIKNLASPRTKRKDIVISHTQHDEGKLPIHARKLPTPGVSNLPIHGSGKLPTPGVGKLTTTDEFVNLKVHIPSGDIFILKTHKKLTLKDCVNFFFKETYVDLPLALSLYVNGNTCQLKTVNTPIGELLFDFKTCIQIIKWPSFETPIEPNKFLKMFEKPNIPTPTFTVDTPIGPDGVKFEIKLHISDIK